MKVLDYFCFPSVQSEAFIALPGGVGTMEELTEILTWAKLELHEKPVGMLNTEGYYDHFLQWVGLLDTYMYFCGFYFSQMQTNLQNT